MNTGRRKSGCPSDEDLSAYADGALIGQAQLKLESHLESCPRCRGRAEDLARTSSGLRHLFQQAAEEIDAARGPIRAAGGGVPPRWLLVGLAAAAAVLVAVTLLLLRPSDVSDTPLHQPEPESTAEVPGPTPKEEAVEVLFAPSAGPLRADTLPLARAGDVDARIQLCRLGLNGDLLRPGRKQTWPSAPSPTLEEMEARRKRFAALAERIMGGER